MNENFTHAEIADLVESQLNADDLNWIKDALKITIQEKSARALFLNYSLLGTRYPMPERVKISSQPNPLEEFIADRNMNTLELSRIYLLSSVLVQEPEFFIPKVTQIIQIADKGELSTFLTYLVLLPNPEKFRVSAVEALRTNIATVFDAIALNNPFPARYMTEHEWNQMFLKAAFMQRPLYRIEDIDARANASLARIISDYAHERWAASREVDPYIWRPVGPFLDRGLEADMQRLLKSDNEKEQLAAALCIMASDADSAKELLEHRQDLVGKIKDNGLGWAEVIE